MFTLLMLLAVLFVLTYDPRSRTLENVIEPCCNNNEYRANNMTQCESGYYQGVQFGNTDYGCPTKSPKEHMGAIIGN